MKVAHKLYEYVLPQKSLEMGLGRSEVTLLCYISNLLERYNLGFHFVGHISISNNLGFHFLKEMKLSNYRIAHKAFYNFLGYISYILQTSCM